MGTLRMVATALVVALLTLSCSAPPPAPDTIVARAVDPGFLHGTAGGGVDRLAATVVTDVQEYWSTAFPASFGSAWRNLDGGFFSVDTTRSAGQPPPCSGDSHDVEGNAYYCATVDAIAWDRAALLPVLREHYGEAAVAVVLAHEFGHAVQRRNGTDLGEPVRSEAMADCYSGAFTRWVSDGHSRHLRIRPAQLDPALRALIVFRDPVGTAASDADAHGTAFDRVSAFQDGFRAGARQCARVGGTVRATASETHRSLPEVVRSPATRSFFRALATNWRPPQPRWSPRQGCAVDLVTRCGDSLVIDRPGLARLHHDLGDQATATLVASRYALAALAARGRPVTGKAASEQVTCLTGAYTTAQVDGPLSPGDLDAAVETLLATDRVSDDASGSNPLTGMDRLGAFRAGAEGGAAACG